MRTKVVNYGQASHDDIAFPKGEGSRIVTQDGRDAFDIIERDGACRIQHHSKYVCQHFQVVRPDTSGDLADGEIRLLDYIVETKWASEWAELDSVILSSYFANEAIAQFEAQRLSDEIDTKRRPLYAQGYEGPDVGILRTFDL